jgi:hypothetical protein
MALNIKHSNIEKLAHMVKGAKRTLECCKKNSKMTYASNNKDLRTKLLEGALLLKKQ